MVVNLIEFIHKKVERHPANQDCIILDQNSIVSVVRQTNRQIKINHTNMSTKVLYDKDKKEVIPE